MGQDDTCRYDPFYTLTDIISGVVITSTFEIETDQNLADVNDVALLDMAKQVNIERKVIPNLI